jgi:methionyl aminopeptidase
LKETPSLKEELEAYRRAGRIASTVRKEVLKLVQPKKQIREICEETENMIRKMGGNPAFPTNVSIDYVAAHYTSPPNDETLIPNEGLVKVDLGASIDGYLSDTAVTIDVGGFETPMVAAAEGALRAAISIVKAGIDIKQVGKTISSTIVDAGFRPVSNLTGHSLARYELHSGISLPNVPTMLGHTMKEGEVFAIEPFVTKRDGRGYVKDTDDAFIFSCSESRAYANQSDDPGWKLLVELRKRFGRLPFALRWLDESPDAKQFRKLVRSGSVISYPVLVESGKRIVAQAEHTILVKKYGCEVLTV